MSKFNISQAAKLTGKSRSTIQAHLKKGKISAISDGVGKCMIDAVELHRVYGVLDVNAVQNHTAKVAEKLQYATPDDAPQDTNLMHEKIRFLQEKIAFFEKQIDLEREEKNRLLSLVETQARQLTDQRKKRWWFR